jgi:hypothetical protein
VDDPHFADFNKKPGHSHLRENVKDINHTDKFGNPGNSPEHSKMKGLNKYYLQNDLK